MLVDALQGTLGHLLGEERILRKIVRESSQLRKWIVFVVSEVTREQETKRKKEGMAMTTTINSITKFKASVRYTNAEIEINVPTETRGIRRLVLDRHSIAGASLTDDEALIVQQLLDSGLPNRGWTEELTVSELKLLGSVGSKIGAPMGTVPVKVESSPGVNEKPVMVAPAPANEVKPLGKPDTSASDYAIDKTNNNVLHGFARKTPGIGIDATERSIDSMRKVIEKLKKEGVWQIQYDIGQDTGVTNPSNILWRYGFRSTLSCWILPQSSMEKTRVQDLLKHWEETGVDVTILPIGAEGIETIIRKAEKELDREIRRVHTSLINNIAAADQRLKDAQAKFEEREKIGDNVTDKEQQTALAKRDNDVRKNLRLAGNFLNDAIICAEMFDNTERVEHLLKALRECLKSSTESFNAEMRLKGRTQAPEVK